MRQSRRTRSCRIVRLALTVVFCLSTVTDGQAAPPRVKSPVRRGISEQAAAVVEPSAPIVNLFARAEEGIQRGDWKFAIDSLQRIIEDEAGSLILRAGGAGDGGQLFESSRRKAIRLLASLPAPGLGAYRILHDGKAKGLLERAIAEHDVALLRKVVHQYLLTRYGDDAADVLASWALDEGRPAEAMSVLETLGELVVDSDVPDILIASKLAAAAALLGDAAVADTLIASYDAGRFIDKDEVAWLSKLSESAGRDRALRAGHARRLVVWTQVGGDRARTGIMAAVQPSLFDPLPWRFDLPGAAAWAWERAFADDPDEPLSLPAPQLVTDGRLVFARTPDGCVALDLDDLSVVWEVPPAVETARSFDRAPLSPSRSISRSDPTRHYLFEDYVAGSPVLAHGMVFTVERSSPLRYQAARAVRRQPRGRRQIRKPALPRLGHVASRMIAYDAATGDIRWQRGMSDDPLAPLGNVEFRSPPLAVGDFLWVPYLKQTDLFAAILNPEDGSLVHSTLLCSLTETFTSRGHALQPAYADGVVYIPTGHGLLLAVDAVDYTLRWANRYRKTRRDRGALRRGVWLTTPPVVSNGLVLLAPVDYDKLLALATSDGALRWSASVPDTSYVVAADGAYVWLGGRSVHCLSLLDGEPQWQTQITSMPTGRAVLSGELIHVPTVTGLFTLSAATGELVDHKTLPSSAVPLGNLLCLGSAMLNVDPTGVRKLPDLGRMYPEARAAHAAAPRDVRSVLRLAWLELLQDQPARALAVLDSLRSSASASVAQRAADLAHLRVETLLALAAKSTDAPLDALKMLRQAGDIAPTPADRLRCALAESKQLDAVGQPFEACRSLWSLAFHLNAAQIISLGEQVQGTARIEIHRRLRSILPKLKSHETQQLEKEAAAKAADLLANLGNARGDRDTAQRLFAVAHLPGFREAATDTLVALADWYAGQRRYEQAEQMLREAGRLGTDPSDTAGVLKRLCELYETSLPGATALRAGCLDELERRFSDVVVGLAEARLGDVQRPGDVQEPQPLGRTVGGWVQAARERLAGGRQSQPTAGATRWPGRRPSGSYTASEPSFVLSDEPSWWLEMAGGRRRQGIATETLHTASFELPAEVRQSIESANTPPRGGTARFGMPRMVQLGETVPAGLTDRIVFFGPNDLVYCQRAVDGEILWHTRLRLPETFSSGVSSRRTREVGAPRRAVVDGQTAVFNARGGLFAVGLVTGKRLWVRPFDTDLDANDVPSRDAAMAAGDGYLAALPHSGRLALMRISDGSILWERELRGEPVDRIWLVDELIVAMDVDAQRVHVFDRLTGTLLHQTIFRQPDAKNEAMSLIHTAGVLCGPMHTDEGDELRGVKLTSGETLWRQSFDKPLIALFSPADGYVGVGLLGGDVRILKAATGETVLDRHLSRARVVTDGKLFDGTFLVQYVNKKRNKRYPALVALDVATGEELWLREDLAPLAASDARLRLMGGYVMTLVEHDEPKARRNKRIDLAIIDARTGLNVGPEISVVPRDAMSRPNGDFHVWAGGVIIGTDTKILGYSKGPSGDGAEGDS